MPRRSYPPLNKLLDTWGRKNRKLEDKICQECGSVYRPKRLSSKYCSRRCTWKNNGGQNRKKEIWWINSKGYIEGKIWISDTKQICVKQHRWIMEKYLGRKLLKNEDVHHINRIKSDNRLENLELIDHTEHTIRTHIGRRKNSKAEGTTN